MKVIPSLFFREVNLGSSFEYSILRELSNLLGRPLILSYCPVSAGSFSMLFRKGRPQRVYHTNSKVMSRGIPRLLMCAMSAERASDTVA